MERVSVARPEHPALAPAELRARIRAGLHRGSTAGFAPGYVQANFVALPGDWAEEFARFCALNAQACPLIGTTQPGSADVPDLAPGADLRTDIPAYRVYRAGRLVETRQEITELWSADLIGFLIGCSFTFDHYLLAAGITVRHVECGCNVSMYRTTITTVPTERLAGPLVVSMRPIPVDQVDLAVATSACFPSMHGAPVHIGDPAALGIEDLSRPDYGDAVEIHPGDVPVFWACGVTPQAVAIASGVPLMITHAPGCMFVTDQIIEAERPTAAR